MSNFNLGKKLILPTKKAWKSFTNKLQSRLHKLKLSKAIKSSKNLCIRAYNYIFPIITQKFYSLVNRKRSHRNFYRNYYHYQQCHVNTASPIYLDQLFPEPILKSERQNHSGSKMSAPQAEEFVASSSGVDVNCRSKLNQEEQEIIMRAIEENSALKKGKAIESGTNCYRTFDNTIDEWRTPSMPHINGVDRRAEEFISKFREDMQLERQQSILDFQEMLARGT
ncbi:hypothetical protein HAX54_000057 [Datura stramonium]|uniref:Uncharacterized protein n=1 Tax=Datura stramonium TaxID=4076 RepID=A0ABS8RFS4_DATST|nr:hypothetical protein [Datura stramonium]